MHCGDNGLGGQKRRITYSQTVALVFPALVAVAVVVRMLGVCTSRLTVVGERGEELMHPIVKNKNTHGRVVSTHGSVDADVSQRFVDGDQ
jgi:hypothetical protein